MESEYHSRKAPAKPLPSPHELGEMSRSDGGALKSDGAVLKSDGAALKSDGAALKSGGTGASA